MDAVVGLLREMNFPNIQVVDMSANTTKEQMQIVRCSGLLIGECAEHGEMRECECECECEECEYWVWPWCHTSTLRAQVPLARRWRGRQLLSPRRSWWSCFGRDYPRVTFTVASRRQPIQTTKLHGAR